jgi:hypothetical protein
MPRKKRASQRAKKPQRITPREQVETRILEHLGSSRVQKTSVLAVELGYSPTVTRKACERLYEGGSLRRSRIPYYLYFFPLTRDILQRANYPVVTRLIGLSQGAWTGGAIAPNLRRIFATLRRSPALKGPAYQNYISRCEQAATRARSEAELQERISLRPFRRWATHWWPQALERQYQKPMSRIVETLRKPHVQHLAAGLHEVALDTKRQLASNPSLDANKAERVVREALEHYAAVADTLEDSGAQNLLRKRDSQLTSIASLETIPADDLKVVAKEELEDSLDVVHGVPSAQREHPDQRVLRMTPRQVVELVLEAAEVGSTKGGRPPSGGWRHWLLQSLRLGIGGSLVVADLSLGLGSLVGTLLSAGGGDVGIAIALASSIHTGAKTAIDALSSMLKTA